MFLADGAARPAVPARFCRGTVVNAVRPSRPEPAAPVALLVDGNQDNDAGLQNR
jgi:hypothetical protein